MYVKPKIICLAQEKIIDEIGPVQTSYAAVEFWRGAKLDNQRPAEYRTAELDPVIQSKKEIC